MDEIGAVLIDGIISQVHADIILGRETTLGARRKETPPALFWDLTWPPGLRDMERKRMSRGFLNTGKTGSWRSVLKPGV